MKNKKSNNIPLSTLDMPGFSRLVVSIYPTSQNKYYFVFKLVPFDGYGKRGQPEYSLDDDEFMSTALDYANAKEFHAMLLPIAREPEYMTKLKKAEFMSAVNAPDLKNEIDIVLPCRSKKVTLRFVYRQEKNGYMVAHLIAQEDGEKIHFPFEIIVDRYYDPSIDEEVTQIHQVGLCRLVYQLERYFEHVDNINIPNWSRNVHAQPSP